MPNKDKCVWAGRKVGFFKKVLLFFFLYKEHMEH